MKMHFGRRPAAMLLCLLLGAFLSACAARTDENVSDRDLFAAARENYLAWRSVFSDVQLAYDDGEWDVTEDGTGSKTCRESGVEGYRFTIARMFNRADIDIDLESDIGLQAVKDTGFTQFRVVSYAEGQRQVQAKDREYVSSLIIDIGDNGNISIQSESTCFPGNGRQLNDIRYPTVLSSGELDPGLLPVKERPSDAPLFPIFARASELPSWYTGPATAPLPESASTQQ